MAGVAGRQVPGLAESPDPTFATPVMPGAVTLTSGTSLKGTKPLGQLPLLRVTTAQEKSPPQLSWETTIWSAETTRSTYATCPTEPAGPVLAFHHATAPTRGVPSVM